MDKFANEDSSRCDAPEYVAVQAGIDAVKDDAVFVIATANDIRKLPDSLRRSGRFDAKDRSLCANGVEMQRRSLLITSTGKRFLAAST